MGRTGYNDAEKTKIVREYRAAVAAGHGGGSAVAKKYGVHAAIIHGWGRTHSKNGHGHQADAELHQELETQTTAADFPTDTVAPYSELQAAIDKVIAYHQSRIEALARLRDGAVA